MPIEGGLYNCEMGQQVLKMMITRTHHTNYSILNGGFCPGVK